MKRLYMGLEPQQRFPHEDLTATNATLLEVLLADTITLGIGHRAAEVSLLLYRAGHPAIQTATARTFDTDQDQDRRVAMTAGVTTYEAMAVLVRPYTPPYNVVAVTSEVAAMAIGTPGEVLNYLTEADETFRRDLPNAAAVVIETAARAYRGHEEYVLHGAALACQMELEVAK